MAVEGELATRKEADDGEESAIVRLNDVWELALTHDLGLRRTEGGRGSGGRGGRGAKSREVPLPFGF